MKNTRPKLNEVSRHTSVWPHLADYLKLPKKKDRTIR